jgi:spectinomycin phosphotransferase
MLEPPALNLQEIRDFLRYSYDAPIAQVEFMPLGVDANNAVYRAIAKDGTDYFIKLRRGDFNEIAVLLPSYLKQRGVAAVIEPIPTTKQQLWTQLHDYTLVLYPFVTGGNAFERTFTNGHWQQFGAALRHIHALPIPEPLRPYFRHELFSARWRERLTFFMKPRDTYSADPIAIELLTFLGEQQKLVFELIARATSLAELLRIAQLEQVICHGDIHAGNVMIDHNDSIWLVDWDMPILAPKERDLMFVGGDQGFVGRSASDEEELFYAEYGSSDLNYAAIAYYRYERIIEDIALYCEDILLQAAAGADRAQALHYVKTNFKPDGTIAQARRADLA